MFFMDKNPQEFFNKETGTFDLLLNHNKLKAKVFFSGMLSGQRALDLGSYDRLKWHMKAVNEGRRMVKDSIVNS